MTKPSAIIEAEEVNCKNLKKTLSSRQLLAHPLVTTADKTHEGQCSDRKIWVFLTEI